MRSDVVKRGSRRPKPLSALCPGLHPGGAGAPLIGVVCSYNEIVPGHMNLDKIAEAVKAGVRSRRRHPRGVPRHRRV